MYVAEVEATAVIEGRNCSATPCFIAGEGRMPQEAAPRRVIETTAGDGSITRRIPIVLG